MTTRVENINDETKDYAGAKAEKFDKFYRLRRIEIIMDMEGDQYKVDMVLSPERGGTIVATASAGDWLSAIDNVSDRAERQLRRLKEKVKSHRVKKYRPEIEGRPEEEEESYDDFVTY
jgi:putative sigma-54 modulation protein